MRRALIVAGALAGAYVAGGIVVLVALARRCAEVPEVHPPLSPLDRDMVAYRLAERFTLQVTDPSKIPLVVNVA